MPDKPVSARVDAAVKQGLLDLVDYAAGQGWPAFKTCEVLGLSQRRQRRWRRRQEGGEALDDGRPGASINALTPCEAEAIVKAFETFADKDFFHRRLAHRGSYNGLFWVSASTVRRVLNDHDLRFRHPPRPSGPSAVPSRCGRRTDPTRHGSTTPPTSPPAG